MLLGHKLMEEMKELEDAIAQADQEKILEEVADVQEVNQKLFSLIKEYNEDDID
jgi:phosphoribosyl-ATP pyrophosphohydrolase